MDLALDLIERAPTPALVGLCGASALLALAVAAVAGGSVAIVALLLGAAVVLGSGAVLATKVHLGRLPLEVAPVALQDRLDGHPAYRFRARLGRGRRMDRAAATVRFFPDAGDPVDLEPLLGRAQGLVGPWTVVVVDRAEVCTGPGRFEVRIRAAERSREWSAEASFSRSELKSGRFVPALAPRPLRLLAGERWDQLRDAEDETGRESPG
ncbi:MAG: hypothetical protein AB8H79_09515 [Myxococcota bacterium]